MTMDVDPPRSENGLVEGPAAIAWERSPLETSEPDYYPCCPLVVQIVALAAWTMPSGSSDAESQSVAVPLPAGLSEAKYILVQSRDHSHGGDQRQRRWRRTVVGNGAGRWSSRLHRPVLAQGRAGVECPGHVHVAAIANEYAVRDIEISCAFIRRDGRHLTAARLLIHDTVNMKSRRTFARMQSVTSISTPTKPNARWSRPAASSA